MSEVKRYDIAAFEGGMDEMVDGAWVYFEDHERQVGELRDELGACKGEYDRSANKLAALQAKPDTAMGLLLEHQWQWQPYDDHYHRDSGHRCVECGGYRDGSGHEEYCELGNFLSTTSTEGKELNA